MKLEIHVHVHNHMDDESLALIKETHVVVKQTKELVMALSAEMQAFVDSTNTALAKSGEALANISADTQRLLAGATGLSPEDKAALLEQTGKMDALAQALTDQAAVVPEP